MSLIFGMVMVVTAYTVRISAFFFYFLTQIMSNIPLAFVSTGQKVEKSCPP